MSLDFTTEYLSPTWYVDSDHPALIEFSRRIVGDATDPTEKSLRLFHAVRDEIRYSAYGISLEPDDFRASRTLTLGRGWCVTKSCLLAAVARAAEIPCRLGYANVRNHLATQKLLKMMTTDVFYYHGYNEFLLNGRWVKATVAFNSSLCEKAGLKPLDWDGRTDSLYHPCDVEGRRHMEYLHDHGAYTDVPREEIVAQFHKSYPVAEMFAVRQAGAGDFEAEIERETRAASQRRDQSHLPAREA